ncbi:MAG: LysR family transcriptional regulator [Candidatus Bathyarchaeota archaeon]|nr:MAG: LysR family transcriptional regulator [Candidatus Bathyarchaeota archaeon]
MLTPNKHKPSYKVWIEYKGKPVLGKGGAEILKAIAKQNSITKAAEALSMSYRYVWNYLQKIQKAVEAPIMETFRGGKAGGGGAKLTLLGRSLLEEYLRVESYLSELLAEQDYWQVLGLKTSSRTRLKGKVLSMEKDQIRAKVKVEIKTPAVITAVIAKEAVEELGVKVGDEVQAIVKPTEMIIGK